MSQDLGHNSYADGDKKTDGPNFPDPMDPKYKHAVEKYDNDDYSFLWGFQIEHSESGNSLDLGEFINDKEDMLLKACAKIFPWPYEFGGLESVLNPEFERIIENDAAFARGSDEVFTSSRYPPESFLVFVLMRARKPDPGLEPDDEVKDALKKMFRRVVGYDEEPQWFFSTDVPKGRHE